MSMNSNAEKYLENNSEYLKRFRARKSGRLVFKMNPGLKRLYDDYTKETDVERKELACSKLLDAIDDNPLWRHLIRCKNALEFIRVHNQQRGYRNKTTDNSPRNCYDYYSVAVIVKNEARFIREWVLFYKATGADRIYIYDNDSSDNLLEELSPFLESGFVVYRYLHGPVVQTFAYRDVIRRAKRKTKWLAIVDADEFLFSPKGPMPEQLKAYEDYPAVGANWVVFGPSGHKTRPEGLLMDNYIETFEDADAVMNHHIKSILQPREVFSMRSPHFALYKGHKHTVNENKETIDNRCAYIPGQGKAFTEKNNREVFRINHYFTRSLEDLEEKCNRGSAAGLKKVPFEDVVRGFEVLMIKDYSIKPYADMIREEYYSR